MTGPHSLRIPQRVLCCFLAAPHDRRRWPNTAQTLNCRPAPDRLRCKTDPLRHAPEAVPDRERVPDSMVIEQRGGVSRSVLASVDHLACLASGRFKPPPTGCTLRVMKGHLT